MEHLIETIRGAIAHDASDETRAAGANACREILRSLEPEPAPVPAVASAPALTQVAQLVTAFRGVPIDQLLDLAIVKLRSVVPADTAPTRPGFAVPLVPVPRS
ncbi:MAG: hypothetical protein H0T46_06065 [Deltaproteobacteria bacterium]|nr:hypothetical protein [Deltaproteobacteria bacterium]